MYRIQLRDVPEFFMKMYPGYIWGQLSWIMSEFIKHICYSKPTFTYALFYIKQKCLQLFQYRLLVSNQRTNFFFPFSLMRKSTAFSGRQ